MKLASNRILVSQWTQSFHKLITRSRWRILELSRTKLRRPSRKSIKSKKMRVFKTSISSWLHQYKSRNSKSRMQSLKSSSRRTTILLELAKLKPTKINNQIALNRRKMDNNVLSGILSTNPVFQQNRQTIKRLWRWSLRQRIWGCQSIILHPLRKESSMEETAVQSTRVWFRLW